MGDYGCSKSSLKLFKNNFYAYARYEAPDKSFEIRYSSSTIQKNAKV
jgi:hypothetical protein